MFANNLEYFARKGMARVFVLEEVSPGGNLEIGRIQSGDVAIGRDPGEGGLVINREGVSRNHGMFSNIRDHWLYRDMGSTNGSWLNGVKLVPGEWKLVRSGANLQVADCLMRLSETDESVNLSVQQGTQGAGAAAIGGRSLLVFSGADFVDEFLIPEYGKALSIGGSNADLALTGDIFDQPSLVIERRGDRICAFGIVKDNQIFHNDRLIQDFADLGDGDTVKLANYTIILNDPSRSDELGASSKESVVSLREWGVDDAAAGKVAAQAAAKRNRRSTSGFGRSVDDDVPIDETVALDTREMRARIGAEVHPSMRYVKKKSGRESFSSVEDIVILSLGVVLFLLLLAFVVMWFFW